LQDCSLRSVCASKISWSWCWTRIFL